MNEKYLMGRYVAISSIIQWRLLPQHLPDPTQKTTTVSRYTIHKWALHKGAVYKYSSTICRKMTAAEL
jgi:hypothetical protein